jgi:hypothetical protein
VKGFELSDERNGQTGEIKQCPPAALSLFGLFDLSEMPENAVSLFATTACGLFGLFGWETRKDTLPGRSRGAK